MTKIALLTLLVFFSLNSLALAQSELVLSQFEIDDYNVNSPTDQTGGQGESQGEGQGESEGEGAYFVSTFSGFYNLGYGEDGFRKDAYELPNAYGPSLPKAEARFFSARLKSKRCPEVEGFVSVAYPVNLGPELDAYVKGQFEEFFAAAQDRVATILADWQERKEGCLDLAGDSAIYQSSFKVLSGGPKILSILAYHNLAAGYFHPSNGITISNLDAKTAKPLSMADFFPDRERSLKRLWPFLANQYCSMENGGGFLPNFYGGGECQAGGYGENSPLPVRLDGAEVTFENLGGMVYADPTGLWIGLNAYAAWGYASNDAWVLVPKSQALEMGASASLW
ncbi:MAG: hypothetical protein LBJ61_03410 [Deltaproteobacteria bacterium]|jgi:hypothetical protein|nr:hypothetical protein [Deltaproteobacteria bacterium]